MIDVPTIVLAVIAAAAFTIIAVSAPKVIRQHRQDVLLRKFSREFVAAFEAATKQLVAAFEALMPTLQQAALSIQEFADAATVAIADAHQDDEQ